MLRNLISLQIKILKLFYKFNYEIEALGGEKQIIQCTAKMKDSISLKKIEERESSFWLKKYFIVLSSVIRTKTQEEKNPEIIETVESNYKTSRPGSFY